MNDLINRQAAIESIRECAEAAHDNHEWDMEQGYLNAIECVEEEPSVQPEQRVLNGWVCPVCGRGLSPFINVCPCNNGKGWEITC